MIEHDLGGAIAAIRPLLPHRLSSARRRKKLDCPRAAYVTSGPKNWCRLWTARESLAFKTLCLYYAAGAVFLDFQERNMLRRPRALLANFEMILNVGHPLLLSAGTVTTLAVLVGVVG